MPNNHLDLEQALHNAGQSITAPRLAVFDFLAARGTVSTYAIVAACAATSDRASVYRSLSLFRQLGIIQDLVVGGKKVVELSDAFSGHHHHLYCTSCGKSVDITDPTVERRLENLAEQYGFLATTHQIELSGLCSTCR